MPCRRLKHRPKVVTSLNPTLIAMSVMDTPDELSRAAAASIRWRRMYSAGVRPIVANAEYTVRTETPAIEASSETPSRGSAIFSRASR